MGSSESEQGGRLFATKTYATITSTREAAVGLERSLKSYRQISESYSQKGFRAAYGDHAIVVHCFNCQLFPRDKGNV